MQWRSHAAIGLAATTALMALSSQGVFALPVWPGLSGVRAMQVVTDAMTASLPMFILALLGSLMPDIDHPEAKIARFVPVIPTLLYRSTGHRGATHSLLAAVLSSLIVAVLLPFLALPSGYASWYAIGYLLHLAADFVTNRGVTLFWPLKQRVGLPLGSTGGVIELVALLGSVAVILAAVVGHFGSAPFLPGAIA